MAETNSQGLSNVAVDAKRRWAESERECQEWVQEVTLLQAEGSELCQTIVGPLKVRGLLLEGMWIAAICHTEMVVQFTMLGEVVSFSA
jgi:hypothetical protein